MERTGEKVDETVRTIAMAVKNYRSDKIQDAADDLKKGAENAADEAKNKIRRAFLRVVVFRSFAADPLGRFPGCSAHVLHAASLPPRALFQ